MKENVRNIQPEDFFACQTPEEKIKFLLQYAILAPSTHNSQPWLFKVEEETLTIYPDKKLVLPEADQKGRDLYISLGCCLENFLIASDFFKLPINVTYEYENNVIVLRAKTTSHFNSEGFGDDVKNLFEAIQGRYTARGKFRRKSIPQEVVTELQKQNVYSNIRIHFVTDEKRIEQLALLTAEGVKHAYKKKSFREEMSRWFNPNYSDKRQGLPGYALGMPILLSTIFPILVKYFDIGPLVAKLNFASILTAPMVAVITTDEDNPHAWINAGRLCQRNMLYLHSQRIRSSIFVAAVEMGELYRKVQKIIGTKEVPIFLFCAGYMESVQKLTMRQSLESKIL